MNLIRYRPVTKSLIDWDFDTVLNRFFSESFKHSDAGFPKVDVSVDENRYLVEANLPGLTEKNVDVKVDGDLLTISSIEKEEKKENAKEYIIRERHDAEFSRSFTLPKDIDKDNIKATFKNGVLTLELHKTPEAKPRSIEVKSN